MAHVLELGLIWQFSPKQTPNQTVILTSHIATIIPTTMKVINKRQLSSQVNPKAKTF